jgi:translation initiation factor 2 beta subunit (eIF-2beta)/eIF-5
MINIGGDLHDSHYRYKRNQIQISTVNQKGGITKIMNMEHICKQLKTPIEFMTAFYNRVKKTLGRTMIQSGSFRGVLTVEELEKILNIMIKKFILCPQCKLPEWDRQICKACGYQKSDAVKKRESDKEDVISIADMTKPQVNEEFNLEFKISDLMKKLYDLRISERKDIKDIDFVINKLWSVTDVEEYKKMEKYICNKIGYNI